MKIEAVILYCLNDVRFLKPCIDNLLKAGIKCNVITCSHLYAGEPENIEVLENSIMPYSLNDMFNHYRMMWYPGQSSLFWEALGRYYATRQMVNKDCDYVLYIDADEIIDYRKFLQFKRSPWFLNQPEALAFKLKQYTYSITPYHRLNVKAYNTVLCKYEYAVSLPFTINARFNAYWNNKNKWSRRMGKIGLNKKFVIYKGKPFIHHFTGVRTKEEMFIKVANWSHNSDRNDWADVIENDFKIKGNKIGSHTFELVPNHFNIAI